MEKEYSFLSVFLQEPIFLIEHEKGSTEVLIPEDDLPFFFIGENKKHITVLVEFKGADIKKSPDYEQLVKILNAASLTQHEVAIVPVEAMDQYAIGTIKETLQPQSLLLFGKIFSRNPVNADTYQVITKQGVSYLFSESLAVLNADRSKKKALWEGMKTLFQIGS